jgi:hypothetical protein
LLGCAKLQGEQKNTVYVKQFKRFLKHLFLFPFSLGPTLNENETVGALIKIEKGGDVRQAHLVILVGVFKLVLGVVPDIFYSCFR